MNDKQEQLLGLLRGGTLQVIPARGTAGWNNLSDLVAQRTYEELREVFAELSGRNEQQAFVWLVTVVTDFDSAKHIIWHTLARQIVNRELESHADEIGKGWDALTAAENAFSKKRNAAAKRRKLLLRQCARLREWYMNQRRVSEDAYKRLNEARKWEDKMRNQLDEANARIAELETFVRVAVDVGGVQAPTNGTRVHNGVTT